MASKEERAQFLSELKQRFEGLTTWAIEAWPDSEKPLSRADFDIARKALLDMADRGDIGDRNAAVPEPSEDGPQYRNVNPAPWP